MKLGRNRAWPTAASLRLVRLGILAGTLALACDSPERREARTAKAIYEANCSVCHDSQRAGEDPAAPDLRTLTRRLGPPYPRLVVAAYIDGRETVAAHGSRAMPVWGDAFYQGWPEGSDREAARAGTVELLVDYLESIQVD